MRDAPFAFRNGLNRFTRRKTLKPKFSFGNRDMRIGLFGGTFNPVHLGHLRAAVEVRQGFELDEIHLIPAALPPHKVSGELAASADRLHMLNLALGADAGLKISDVELNRSGPSYTIDT